MNQEVKTNFTKIFTIFLLLLLIGAFGYIAKRELELKKSFLVPHIQVNVLSWSPSMSQVTLESHVDLDLSDFILRQGQRNKAFFLKDVVLKANVPKTITLKHNFLNKEKNTLTLLMTIPVDWKEDFEHAEK